MPHRIALFSSDIFPTAVLDEASELLRCWSMSGERHATAVTILNLRRQSCPSQGTDDCATAALFVYPCAAAVVNAVLITGDTYTSRSRIRQAGGRWNRDEGGWIVPAARIGELQPLIDEKGFETEEVDVEPDDLEAPTGQRLRAVRQEKLDRKVANLRERAAKKEKHAQRLQAQLKAHDDQAFWTEPVKVGHHSAKRHRNLRDKLSGKIDRKYELLREADALRNEAEWLEARGVRVAGDAQRTRQAECDRNDAVLDVGSRVRDFAFGPGTIVRKNRKSYTITFDSGGQYRRGKSLVEPA